MSNVRRQWKVERTMAAPPELVWALATDTNRWDRIVGFSESQWATEAIAIDGERGEPSVRRVGRVPMYWSKEARFLEFGHFVEGKSLFAGRRFLDGAWDTCGYSIALAPHDGATQLEMICWIEFRSEPAASIDAHFQQKMLPTMERYLSLVEAAAAPHAHTPRSPNESPCTFLRSRLLAQPTVDGLAGRSSPTHEEELTLAGQRLVRALDDRELALRLMTFVRERSDDELRVLRPYELAVAWGIDPKRLLRAFLLGTESGLFELRWAAICPVCRVSANEFGRLHETSSEVSCTTCTSNFTVDLASNLEATFRVHPAIRHVEARYYCKSGPWERPHLVALLDVAAGSERTFVLDALPEPLLFAVHEPAVWVATWHQDSQSLALGEVATVERRDDAFVVTNQSTEPLELYVERPQVGLACRAVDLLTMPEFLDRFSDDAPRAGGELSIGDATLLFADLTGSTALYEELGDARAFALVQKYFRAIEHIAAEHDGALVKTMGDGVMVTFRSAQTGLRAALQMLALASAVDARLRLKVGLHTGPCLIVGGANHRLDFFGTSVNIAARLCSLAAAGQALVLASFLQRAQIAQILAEHHIGDARFPTRLRGLRDEYDCVAIALPTPATTLA